MDDRWREIDAIVQDALDVSGAAREALIRERCVDDAELRAEVESLIQAAESTSRFLDTPAPVMAGRDPDAPPPERIGPYRIGPEIGSGGMGVVYKAEQTEPLQRTVAVKLIKLGMDTRQVVARFEAERQALALMEHPAIARVLDAGAAPDGRPFFVMEYVSGVPITEYADRRRLSTTQRLELMIQVCEGIQHAHQKGVIHRDLKPSNVLVEEIDGRAVPKIIDFGVAKATQQRLTERTLFTEQGQLIGTPEYMSPEQADGGALDVDTRTDIYSLGVLLYELLVGALPFDSKWLRSAGYAEVRRIIREQEPPRPSTRLSSLGDSTLDAAKRRGAEVAELLRQLRGDLDWITLHAMEKDRNRRYASAIELATDIRRHLANEPVLARPPSVSYRAQKFVRRNKAVVAGATLVTFALIAGVIGTTWQAVAATRERDRAEREAATAAAINEFLNQDILETVRADRQGKDVTVREAVEAAEARLEGRFEDQPLVEAAVRTTIGEVHRSLGEYQRAAPHFGRALEIRREHLGDLHLDTLEAINNRATIHERLAEYDLARPLYEEALAGRLRVLGEEHADTLVSVNNLGSLAYFDGDYRAAVEYFERGLRIAEAVLGPTDRRTLIAMNNLGQLRLALQEIEEAGELFEVVYERRLESLGAEHPDTLGSMGALSKYYQRVGRREDSLEISERAYEISSRVLGPTHPDTVTELSNIGLGQMDLGRYEEAEATLRRTCDLAIEAYGEDHPYRLIMLGVLGDCLRARGNVQGSLEVFNEALTLGEGSLPAGHSTRGNLLWKRAESLIALDDRQRALTDLLEAYDIYEASYGANDDRTRRLARWVATTLEHVEGSEAAQPWRERGGEAESG